MKISIVKVTFFCVALMTAPTAFLWAQASKDTSTVTTSANGAGAGNGSSQGAPGSATVSGTGTGTLQDSTKNSVPTGDAGVKSAVVNGDKTTAPVWSRTFWGFGLMAVIIILIWFAARKFRMRNNH